MSVIPFLYNRQLGTKCKAGIRSSNVKLNWDHILSRLVCRKENIYSVQGEGSEVPPFSCKFRKDSQSDLLAVANEDGDIFLYDTSNLAANCVVKSWTAHKNAVFDISWLPDKCQLISGSGDHTACLWDICEFKPISIFKKHTSSIKSVDVCPRNSAIFATGSRDGTINVWDTRVKTSTNLRCEKPAIHICHAHCRNLHVVNGKRAAQDDLFSSVSAVAFQDSENLASAGVADGLVKIWDLRKTYVSNPKYTPLPKRQMNYSESKSVGHGCTSLVFDSSYKTLYACSTSNKIFKYDCHSYSNHFSVYEGFRCATYFVKLALSSDDQYLLCGSSDERAYIWKTSNPGLPILQLHGHRAEVTSVCWSPYDITKLVTCGDDNNVAIWKVCNTEDIDMNVIHAVAKPYSESQKSISPLYQDAVPNSSIVSTVLNKSPVVVQTPSKPAVRAITSFFSPVTPSPTTQQLSPKDTMSHKDSDIHGNSTNIIRKIQNKSPESSQVLTPCNNVNKMNLMSQSAGETSEKLSSPDSKNASTSFVNSSTSAQNKENTKTDVSPEDLKRTNSFGQAKRKLASKHSTLNMKKFQSDSSSKAKGPLKNGGKNKAVAGKTIMNYFSVILSPDK